MLIAMPTTIETSFPFGTQTMKKEIYLDGPAIPFTVGTQTKGHKYFHVPLGILAEHSIFFHDLYSHCSIDDTEALSFDLMDTDPSTFNRFTIWLYYQGIYIDESPDVESPLDYYEQFEQLWTLAEKYRVPSLQRHAADTAIVLLKNLAMQYDFDVLDYWHCKYMQSYIGSPERRFIAGQCAFLILSGQEKLLDPDIIHPALRGDIMNIIHSLYPQLY